VLADGFERYTGIRADESPARALLSAREFDDFFLCWLNRPILDWTKEQVFRFLADCGEEVNPLYRLGFGRVGCAPCINSSKEDIRLWAARFPEMIDKIRGWEERVGRTFFPPILPGGRYERIDVVVEWAKTFRGGRQYSLPILEAEVESGMCMSKWGLCE
ncbi:MAG TPA: phosphoadenosine phosphosulfate reductase family protein, partial [Pirellulales bacterium]|nr:phosphoadenosine phosphosulfate reductase family protein [Pirellulales bacterium]